MKLLMENFRKYLNEEAVTDTTNLGMLINSSRDGKYLLLFDTEEFINSIGKNKLKPKPSDFDEWDEYDQFMFNRQNRKNDPLESKTVQKKIFQSISQITLNNFTRCKYFVKFKKRFFKVFLRSR